MKNKEKIIDRVHKVTFKINVDDRGSLIAIEGDKNLNFAIRRVFYLYGVEKGFTRGQHANKNTTMCFICIKGSCKILLDNGKEKETFFLDEPAKGLICEPMVWKEMFDFSSDCILMVICDTNYDTGEYITSYDEFKEELKK